LGISVASLLNVLDHFLITSHPFEPLTVHNGSRGSEVSEALLKRRHSYEVPETNAPFEPGALHLTIQIYILFTQRHIFLTLTQSSTEY
jgi:hypothetical protein